MDYIVKAYKDWRFHAQFHEIVPDMDDEYLFNEKQSIRESARTLKKYGSTCCNHIRNNETLIRHNVEKTDTLQGIALKYGCSTEQIRRANRLFASDSLFLRQFLLIPVDKSSPYYPNQNGSNPSESTFAKPNVLVHEGVAQARSTGALLPPRPFSIAGEELLQTDDHDGTLNNHHSSSGSGGSKQSKSLNSVAAMSPEEESRKCINDFLNKIDNTISESRKYVEKSKELIASQSDNDLFTINSSDDAVLERRRHSNWNNRENHQNHIRHNVTGSSSSHSDTAHLLNTTQARRVQNSLKQMEKQQDEFFEL